MSTGLLCRWALEQTNPNLGPWVSALDEQFDEEAIAQEADQVAARAAALEAEMARDAAAARWAVWVWHMLLHGHELGS